MECPKCSSKMKFFGEDGNQYCSHCGFHFADNLEDVKEQVCKVLKGIGFKRDFVEREPIPKSTVFVRNSMLFQKGEFFVHLKLWEEVTKSE